MADVLEPSNIFNPNLELANTLSVLAEAGYVGKPSPSARKRTPRLVTAKALRRIVEKLLNEGLCDECNAILKKALKV